MNLTKKLAIFALVSIFAMGMAGCGSDNNTNASANNGQPVKKVLIGVRQDLVPTSYIDEKGTLSGYDIEMAKKIDELLPEYEFEYEPVSQEALLTGLQSGKYKAAIAGFYDSPARREKYLFPKENIGGNLIGLTVRAEDANTLKNLEDIHDLGKKITPIASTSGQYGIVVKYNESHPDKQVQLTPSDWNDEATKYKYLDSKEYDAIVASKNIYDAYTKKTGTGDKYVFNPFTAIKTWSLFNKNEQDFANAYDKALKQLKDSGEASKISEKYFGEDVFKYIDK